MMMQVSSGSERKRKRMISNRESARRSRMKKQQRMEELLKQVTALQSQNAELSHKIHGASHVFLAVESHNSMLRAQLMELTDRLTSLNSVLHMAQEVSGFSMDIPHIPHLLLQPWRLPCPVQPIPNLFQR